MNNTLKWLSITLVILFYACDRSELTPRFVAPSVEVQDFDNIQVNSSFNYDMFKRISVHFEDTAAFNQFSSISIHSEKYGPMRWAMAPGQSLSDAGPLIVPDITTDVWLKALWVNGDVSWLNLNVYDTTMVVAFNTISRESPDWSTNKMNCPDSDNDGIDDCNDDFPYDSLLAYLVVSELYTFAAEDNWPWKGDYDFNDMVMTYGHRSFVSASLEIRSMEIYYKFLARGAANDNGVGFVMQTNPSGASVSGYNLVQNYVNHSGGIETGSTTELSIVAQDLVSSKLASWNTFAHLPVVADTYDTLTVTFTTPRNLAVHTSVDTYLIINQNRGKELRYPNVAPTFNMNTTLFGTGFDASNSATGTYFKQSNGQPWALKIPGEFVYLREHKSITAGYLNFASWASSGGSSNANWYDHTIPTNVDTTKLMLP